MNRAYFVALFLVAGAATGQTDSVMRVPVTDPRPLMLAAIASASGESYGVLTGQVAEAMAQKFQSKTPLYIDVTTIKRYAQAGCSRLKVLFWQDGVLLPGAAAPRKQTIEIGINYCRDGLPPRSLL